MQQVALTPVQKKMPDGIHVSGLFANLARTHLLVVLGVVFFLTPFFAFAQERIGNYTTDITIEEDSSITVLETVAYDFGADARHGIYRDIPVVYRTNTGDRSIQASVKSVSRDGYSEPYDVSMSGNTMRIKIGDPAKTITGPHVYRITYTVFGTFNSFEDSDELYWNAIPHGFAVPIDVAQVRVTAPAPPLRVSCFMGPQGSNTPCTPVTNGTEVTMETVNLNAYEGVTLALAFPHGIVTLPSASQKVGWWFTDNYYAFLPLLILLLAWRIWYTKGRDAKGTGTIIAEYEPPLDLKPVFLGSVVDGELDDRDITAGLLYLAEQGHIILTREEKKEFFIKTTEYTLQWIGDSVGIEPVDRYVAEIFFGEDVHAGSTVTLSELKKDTSLPKRKRKLEKFIDTELQRKGYFANKPQQTRQIWLIGAIAFIALVLFPYATGNIISGVISVISGIGILIFAAQMPKRTKTGALMREKILGFKEFLSVTQKERLDFENAPERSPRQFMEYLPIAIALGVEEKWGEQFKDIYIEKPSWYRGGQFNNFAAAAFVSDFSGFTNSVHSSMKSAAASGHSGTGGGGFGGGGMGGGGGGSW